MLYKLKTSKLFDKPDATAPADLDLFAIEHIAFCPDSRLLAVAGEAGHVILLKFSRTETNNETPVSFFCNGPLQKKFYHVFWLKIITFQRFLLYYMYAGTNFFYFYFIGFGSVYRLQ